MYHAQLEARHLDYMDRIQAAIDAGTLRCVFCKTQLNPKPRPEATRLLWRWDLMYAYPDNLEVQPDGMGYGFQCQKCADKRFEKEYRERVKHEKKYGSRKLVSIISVPINISAEVTRKRRRWRFGKVQVTLGSNK